MQGWSHDMGNTHIAQINLDGGINIFEVFDGHGGREIALYVKDNLVPALIKLDSYLKKDYEKALKEVLFLIDERIKSPEGVKAINKFTPEGS
jgi:protein phosphatase 1G